MTRGVLKKDAWHTALLPSTSIHYFPSYWMGDCPLNTTIISGIKFQIVHNAKREDLRDFAWQVLHQNSSKPSFLICLSLRGRFRAHQACTVRTLCCYQQTAMVTRQILSIVAHTEWKGEMTEMGYQTKAALCVWPVNNTEPCLLCTATTTQKHVT